MNDARCEVVALAKAMLAGRLPYIEGAYQICRLRSRMEGIEHRDPDFDAFVVIESETDALPLQAQRHLWSERALTELEPEFERTQKWAASWSRVSCVRNEGYCWKSELDTLKRANHEFAQNFARARSA